MRKREKIVVKEWEKEIPSIVWGLFVGILIGAYISVLGYEGSIVQAIGLITLCQFLGMVSGLYFFVKQVMAYKREELVLSSTYHALSLPCIAVGILGCPFVILLETLGA